MLRSRWMDQRQIAMNEGRMTATLDVVVGFRARLILRAVECQAGVPDSQVPCRPFSSASTFSCTPDCESQLQHPRTDGSESRVGTSNRQRKLERGSEIGSKGYAVSYPARGSLTRRGSSSRLMLSGRQQRPWVRDRQPRKQYPGRCGEQNGTLVHWVSDWMQGQKIVVAPAGSRTAPVDIDNREDWS